MKRFILISLLMLALTGCALMQTYEDKSAPCDGFKNASTPGDCVRIPLNQARSA